MTKRVLAVLAGVLIMFSANAQEIKKEKKDTLTLSTTIVSKHLWRALPSGSAPCIEPYAAYKYNKLSFSIWGSYAINGSYSEIDIWATYNFNDKFSASFFDYYCPSPGMKNRFFTYTGIDNPHIMDVQLQFNGTKKFPVSIMGSTLIYGNWDKNTKGDQQYSTYIEFGYSKAIGRRNLGLTLGMTPFNKKSVYADGISLFNWGVNVSDKIKISNDFSLPVKTGLVLNAYTEQLFLTFAFTL